MGEMTFTLTGSELCFAGQVLGFRQLLLPRDPFQGYLIEEIAQELFQAQQSLLKKELAQKEEGQVVLVDSLAQAIQILGEPERSIVINQTKVGERPISAYLHYKKQQWTLIKSLESDSYQIEVLEKENQVKEWVQKFLALETKGKPDDQPLEISYNDYFHTLDLAREKGTNEALSHLEQGGLEGEQVKDLVEDMIDPLVSGSLTDLSWSKKEVNQSRGLAFLGGKDRLWLAKANPENNDWMKIKQISSPDFAEDLSQLLGTNQR